MKCIIFGKRQEPRAKGSILGNDEVMYYEKSVTLKHQDFDFGRDWSLKDVMRFDLKDFFSNLEEYSGSLTFFDEEEGKIESEDDKSYSLDLVVRFEDSDETGSYTQYETYRLFLEKDGLIEIEETSKDVNYSFESELS